MVGIMRIYASIRALLSTEREPVEIIGRVERLDPDTEIPNYPREPVSPEEAVGRVTYIGRNTEQ